MSTAETHTAIQSAKLAQSSWSQVSAEDRATVIRAWARAIHENRDALARLITAENVSATTNRY